MKMTGRQSMAALLAGASAVALSAVPASAAAHHATHRAKAVHHAKKVTGTIKLGMGYPLEADGYPIYYGEAKGIFKKYGITIQQTDLTPSAGVGALYSGSIDLLFDGSGVINEAISTGQVKALGTYSEVPVWLMANASAHLKPITSVSGLSELNGKVIGTSTPGSLVTDVEQNLVQQAHSTAKFDYLGASSQTVALQHGLVNVIGAVPATLPIAKANGAVVLASLNKLAKGNGLYTMVGGNNAWVAHHKALLREFNMAYHVALKEANRNVSSLLPILEQDLGASKSEALASFSLQKRYEFLKPLPTSDVRAVLHDISTTLPAAAHTKPSSVVDSSALFG